MGLSRASVANIEAGRQRMLAHTLVELAAAVAMPVEWLTWARHFGGTSRSCSPRASSMPCYRTRITTGAGAGIYSRASRIGGHRGINSSLRYRQ